MPALQTIFFKGLIVLVVSLGVDLTTPEYDFYPGVYIWCYDQILLLDGKWDGKILILAAGYVPQTSLCSVRM